MRSRGGSPWAAAIANAMRHPERVIDGVTGWQAATASRSLPKRMAIKRAKAPVVELESPNLPWSFTLLGPPRTKNTGKSPRPGVVVPSAAYRRWYKNAMNQLTLVRQSCKGTCSRPVDVTAVFYRDYNRGDEDRYQIALGDWLQRSGLVLNDDLIHWTGDTRREIDRENPRIEIRIEAAR